MHDVSCLFLLFFLLDCRTRNVPTEYFVNKCGKIVELIKTIPSRLKGSAHPYSTRAFKKYCSQPSSSVLRRRRIIRLSPQTLGARWAREPLFFCERCGGTSCGSLFRCLPLIGHLLLRRRRRYLSGQSFFCTCSWSSRRLRTSRRLRIAWAFFTKPSVRGSSQSIRRMGSDICFGFLWTSPAAAEWGIGDCKLRWGSWGLLPAVLPCPLENIVNCERHSGIGDFVLGGPRVVVRHNLEGP